ncbi:hypothetical protein PS723_02986 [Pseudomonas fluorescens]|uniref:Uncharacterized protein n=1 Tax=Pseudomonas fluorescens TaxID=294 RepID=A0A5E7D0H4_PSEFL|nr:hypothetical protein PS723_02986 [Pseudomonas fluorescens]
MALPGCLADICLAARLLTGKLRSVAIFSPHSSLAGLLFVLGKPDEIHFILPAQPPAKAASRSLKQASKNRHQKNRVTPSPPPLSRPMLEKRIELS